MSVNEESDEDLDVVGDGKQEADDTENLEGAVSGLNKLFDCVYDDVHVEAREEGDAIGNLDDGGFRHPTNDPNVPLKYRLARFVSEHRLGVAATKSLLQILVSEVLF